MQSLKMAWMITWRVWVFTLIFYPQIPFLTIALIALVAALILRYGMNVSVRTFPIIRLLGKRNVLVQHSKKPVSTQKLNDHSAPPAQPTVAPSVKIIEKASKNGRTTGFEPYTLDKLPVPTGIHMRGVPGVGLSSANHMTNYSVKSGQMGETNFAKALAVTNINGSRDYSGSSIGILDRVNSFWSVAMPSEDTAHKADKVYNTDVDCVVVSGNNILLIDTKFYTSGDVTYTHSGDQLYCFDNSTGDMVKKPRKMTRNMEMALQRFKKHYPKMNVFAYVVMMPTNSGSAQISNVFWPGNIPAVTVEQMVNVVQNLSATSGTRVLDHRTIPNLTSLQKG